MDQSEVDDTREEARGALEDEAVRTRAGFHRIPDPAQAGFSASTSAGLQRLKDQFSFLNEYSDEFILSTGVDVLIKAETAAKKLLKMDKDHKAEDRLYLNRESLVHIKIIEGTDNRLDQLHPARVLPGATCSAAKLWLHAREVMGNSGHAPVSSYDMAAIGLGGCVSAKGWVELHCPASPNLSIKMFGMGSAVSRSSKDEEFPDLEDLADFKSALRVLRGAMSYVHPWNQSIAALENFFLLNGYCYKDLNGLEKHAVLLTRFCDYVLGENASRWRNKEAFLDTKDLRAAWGEFLSQKSFQFKSRNQGNQKNFRNNSTQPFLGQQQSSQGQQQSIKPSERYGIPSFLFNDDICVLWNLGKCNRPAGACRNKRGVALRHVCNWRPDLSKPEVPCAKNHMAVFFHR